MNDWVVSMIEDNWQPHGTQAWFEYEENPQSMGKKREVEMRLKSS